MCRKCIGVLNYCLYFVVGVLPVLSLDWSSFGLTLICMCQLFDRFLFSMHVSACCFALGSNRERAVPGKQHHVKDN